MTRLDELIARADLDGLLRHLEDLCADQDWDELRHVRDRCHNATAVGRQLWPAASYAEYRIALQADAAHGGAILREATGRFSIGPLSEVVASVHDWRSLAPRLEPGPVRALVAYERVVRGEDLSEDQSIDTSVYELPLVLQRWEPRYPLATYEPQRGIFAPPSALPPLRPVVLPLDEARLAGDPLTTDALIDLTRQWTTESNGRADAVTVAGDPLDAIAALGVAEARTGSIPARQALEMMAWAAASGGAHGRRRGMAAGRFIAWWTMASLTGLADDWPVEPDELGEAIAALVFVAWDTPESDMGWTFRLAAADPDRGLAWAVMASDRKFDG